MWGLIGRTVAKYAPWLVGGAVGYTYGVTEEDGQGFGGVGGTISNTVKSGINLVVLFAIGGIIYLIIKRR